MQRYAMLGVCAAFSVILSLAGISAYSVNLDASQDHCQKKQFVQHDYGISFDYIDCHDSAVYDIYGDRIVAKNELGVSVVAEILRQDGTSWMHISDVKWLDSTVTPIPETLMIKPRP